MTDLPLLMTALALLLVTSSIGFLLGIGAAVARHLHKRTDEDAENHNNLGEGK